jgi:hypothetical protein
MFQPKGSMDVKIVLENNLVYYGSISGYSFTQDNRHNRQSGKLEMTVHINKVEGYIQKDPGACCCGNDRGGSHPKWCPKSKVKKAAV